MKLTTILLKFLAVSSICLILENLKENMYRNQHQMNKFTYVFLSEPLTAPHMWLPVATQKVQYLIPSGK